MLCRVLFVAAVVSYVLCVLLLGGVQKEELDAGTLRKLQRHNVNIDATGDRKLRSQCLMEKKLATTLSTRRVNTDEEAKTTTTKPIMFELDTQSAGSPSQWNKLFAYITQKEQNSSNLKETTVDSMVIPTDSNIESLPSPMRNLFVEDVIVKVTTTPKNTAENNEKEKAHYVLHNSDTSQPESNTARDNNLTERSNDVEYISQIVAEILSQRKPKPVQASTVLPVRTFNTNKLVEHIDKVLEDNKRNDAYFRLNYSLDNLTATEKYENSHEKSRSNKLGKQVIEELLNQLRDGDIKPISNIRKGTLNNIQTEMDEGKITLYNKLSDMLKITKNDSNNWLYVVDSHGIKPITSEPLREKEDHFNPLSERDKAIICKPNNEMHLIQKEIYRYICPYSDSSKLRASTPEEQNDLNIDSPHERDKTSYSKSESVIYSNDNKSIWPYFFDNQNKAKDEKIEVEHNHLDIKPLSDHYEPMKAGDFSVDDEYKNKWHYSLERQRNTEQRDLNRENTNLLLNQLNNREKTFNGIDEVNRDKIKTFDKPLYPLGFANNPNGDTHFNTEWAFDIQSAKEFEYKLENEQENPIFIRPKADERTIHTSYPRFNGEFKNTWPYYFESNRITQNPILVDKNVLYRMPSDRKMPLNNHEQKLSNKEIPINSSLDKREKTLNSRDTKDSKSFSWYEMKDSKSTGTLGHNVRDEHKSSIRDETSNTKNSMSPKSYETINWPYFIDKQKIKHDLIMTEDMKREPLYITSSKTSKHNERDLAENDEAYNKLLMNAEARSNLYQNLNNELTKKDDYEKVKSLPPEVLKEIADTVKQIVLRDLKIETPVTSTTKTTITTATPITTTTMEPTTTAITTTTTITTSTIITSSAISTTTVPITGKTTAEPKTTDTPSTTAKKEDNMKIQEASQALKNFMELFEKFNQMKNDNLNLNITKTRDSITQTQRAIVIATAPAMVRKPHASFNIAPVPAPVRNPYAPYKFYAPLLPPMSPYGVRSPYLQTKAMVLDPYLQKIIQIPATIQNSAVDNARSVGRSALALTFQTNSNEIKPLKVPVSKAMIVDNIVVSPKPPRGSGRHLREYSDETYTYRKPKNRYTQRNEYDMRSNRSRDYFKFEDRPKPRTMKNEYSYNDRYYKPRQDYEGVRFHEKLEKEDSWPRSSVEGKCGSKDICNERVVPRQQRPLINIASTYDDTHFRNFLKTQQKVNDMLERILATKTKQNRRSSEVI